MRSVSNGVQWTSRVSPRTKLTASLLAIAILIPIAASAPAPADAATNYILMSRSALLARPMSGTPWRNLKAVADGNLGTPNLCDQNSRHHLRTLAAALVYARTGVASYGAKARGGIAADNGERRLGNLTADLRQHRVDEVEHRVLVRTPIHRSGEHDPARHFRRAVAVEVGGVDAGGNGGRPRGRRKL